MKNRNMNLLAVSFILTTIAGIVVNPLPKPIATNWFNDGSRQFPLSIELEMVDGDNDLIFNAFYDMLQSLESLKYYPKATPGPKASYPPVPQGPTNGSLQKRHENDEILMLETLSVELDTPDAPLEHGMNESYSLHIGENITINAATVWGALHAFKTLQQIVIYEDEIFKIESGVDIWDEPLYSHRGILIDSSRNYLSLEAIKENIDLMAVSKLNVLHWHLSDTQSWPVEIKAHPEMINDAYSESEIYTQSDIKHIIEYAYNKGVRVIPEIDLPGHSSSGWEQVDPELVACKNGWWNSGIAAEPNPGQLDIAYDKTYEVVESVFDELNSLFPDSFFHVGHDELNPNCYNFSNNVWQWYDETGGDFYDLIQHWVDRAFPIFSKDNATNILMWEDIVMSNRATVPKDKVMLQTWLGADSVKNLTSQGYDVIVSTYEHYYLDCGFGQWVTNFSDPVGSWCDPYKSWQNIYGYDLNANLTDTEKNHVKGAEVAVWGEMTDSNNLVQKLWSRASAFAEVVWSGNTDDDGKSRLPDMTQRMFNYREWLVALGHHLDPLAPQYCIKNPHACDFYPTSS